MSKVARLDQRAALKGVTSQCRGGSPLSLDLGPLVGGKTGRREFATQPTFPSTLPTPSQGLGVPVGYFSSRKDPRVLWIRLFSSLLLLPALQDSSRHTGRAPAVGP